MASDLPRIRLVLIAVAVLLVAAELLGWLPPITADYLAAPR